MNEEKKIVIVTENEDQMLLLSCMFLRHGKSNLELYSDCAFIREPQSIGWLLTDEKSVDFVPVISGSVIVFGTGSERQESGKLFLDISQSSELIYQKFQEYVSRPPMPQPIPEPVPMPENKQTKLYLSMALAGGSGKTEGTIVLAKRLAQQGKKVLYINLEEEQDFGFFLGIADKVLDSALDKPVNELVVIRQGDLSYLYPIQMEQSEDEMAERYIGLLREIRRANLYDVILVEIPAKKDWYIICLQEITDKVLVFVRQDAASAAKLESLEREKGMDMEYLYICGLYDKNRQNRLEHMEITEYVPYTGDESVEGLLKNDCMKATAEILR